MGGMGRREGDTSTAEGSDTGSRRRSTDCRTVPLLLADKPLPLQGGKTASLAVLLHLEYAR